jgi:tetratricopeptide (TPR) repeat protein
VAAYLAAVQERLRQAELERAAAQARARAERRVRRLTAGLAAALLGLVAVAAGGGLFVQHQAAQRREDQIRREAEQWQAVESALDKAAGLRRQARWDEAAAELGQARQVLGDARRADLRQRLDGAEAELAQARREAKLLADLEEARLAGARWGRDWFDTEEKQRRYEAALRAYGIDVRDGDVPELAKRLGQLPDAVFDPVMFALDDWAADWFGAPKAPEPELLERLQEAARMADRNEWRAKWRDARAGENIEPLLRLAKDAAGQQLPALALRLLMMALRERGEVSKAIDLLRQGQRNHRGDFWIQFELANLLYKSKDRTPAQLGEAIGCYNAALALRPQTSAAYNNLGNALYDNGDRQGAIDAYRRAIAIDKNHPVAHYNLANALVAIRDLKGAIAEYRRAIELAWKKTSDPHNMFAIALSMSEDVDGAIIEFKKAIEIDPKNVGTRYNLALALLYRKNLKEAIEQLREVIRLEEKHAPAHRNLGNALRQSKDLRGASAEYLIAARLFAGQSRPTDDAGAGHRYNAACCAALAAAVQAEDPGPMPDKVVLMLRLLRQQALQWLNADLALYQKQAERDNAAAKQAVWEQLRRWRQEPDLASVRDEALGKLPEDERQPWRQLWEDVDALLRRVDEKK